MRAAITGASGYIGSHLADVLTARGVDVLRLGRDGPTDRFVPWRLGDTAALDGIDVLVHCAYDFRHQDANIVGTLKLYDDAAAHRVPRILHVSSLAAYEGCRSVYGRTKLRLERETAQRGGISIRPATVWGGRQGGPIGSIERVIRRLPVVPRLVGCSPLRLIHIDDLTALLVGTIEHYDQLHGQVVSASSSDVVEFGQLLSLMVQHAGLRRWFVPVPALFVQFALQVSERLGFALPLRADSILSLRFANPGPDLTVPGFLEVPTRSMGQPL